MYATRSRRHTQNSVIWLDEASLGYPRVTNRLQLYPMLSFGRVVTQGYSRLPPNIESLAGVRIQ
jgi:hypothetical protein